MVSVDAKHHVYLLTYFFFKIAAKHNMRMFEGKPLFQATKQHLNNGQLMCLDLNIIYVYWGDCGTATVSRRVGSTNY